MPKAKSNAAHYAEAERELITQAVAETEQEIFADAFNDTPPENDGDTSLEDMDDDAFLDDDEDSEAEPEEAGEDEGEGAEEGTEPEGQERDLSPPEGRDRGQERRGIPSDRLKQEADARRASEAERDAARAETRELRARLEALERGNRKGEQEERKAAEPDIFADPDAWKKSTRNEIVQEFEQRRINGSFQEAKDEHGERFDQAFQALQRAGQSGRGADVAGIVNAPNPGRALMRWHDQQALVAEIGNDPAAYRERIIREAMSDPAVRRQILTGMREDALRGENAGETRTRTRTRLPPSLSAASGATSHRGGNSAAASRSTRSVEQEIFASAFEDD